MNVQRWQVRQKIISSKETNEDKIINNPLKIKDEVFGRIFYLHFYLKIFPQQPDMQELQASI